MQRAPCNAALNGIASRGNCGGGESCTHAHSVNYILPVLPRSGSGSGLIYRLRDFRVLLGGACDFLSGNPFYG